MAGGYGGSSGITPKQIKYLQWYRRSLGIDDETWNEMKRSVGAESTRDLDQSQVSRLLSRMEAGGRNPESSQWKPVHKSAKKSGMDKPPPADRAAMLSKVEAILADLKLPWGYADGMAGRMFGKERIRWLDSEQTYKLLQALAVYQARRLKRGLREACHEAGGGDGESAQEGARAEPCAEVSHHRARGRGPGR